MFVDFRLRAQWLLLPLGAAVLLFFFPLFLRNCPATDTHAAPSPDLTDPTIAETTPAANGAEEHAAAGSAWGCRTVPVLMYHSVCDHPTARSVYILSPSAFREDLRYLKAHGYETVFLRDLLAFAAGTGTLPEKPVALTFDDGFYNNLTNVLPLLEAENARAELNIVGKYTDAAANEPYRSPNYSYLTWEEVRALQNSGRFELGSHTYAMHALSPRSGCARKSGESEEDYSRALQADAAAMRAAMQREQTDATLIFAYPFGARSDTTQAILEQAGFTVFLTCDERLNTVSAGQPLPPLCRINRTSALSTEAFMQKYGIG